MHTHMPNSMSCSPGDGRGIQIINIQFSCECVCVRLCVRLTGAVIAVANDEDEQQHRGNGGEDHPPDGCSNHSRIRVEGRVRCKTSQLP